MYEEMRKYEEELYPFWRLPKFVDVTREYAYYYKKELKIPPSKYIEKNVTGRLLICVQVNGINGFRLLGRNMTSTT